ncbi:MAG: TetR/AcrR family transcriptional regulator [Candidatus Methanomethylophilaceae archaeon]|jgi:AcrR family transcriptional regulator
MKSSDKKTAILDATIALLKKSDDIDSVTVRDIVKAADANLSTVNYYFGTKDDLMMEAVSKIMEEVSLTTINGGDDASTPRERLESFIMTMSNIVVEYEKYTRSIIPKVLLKDNITLPDTIMPMVRECLPDKNEMYCRTIAYELIIFLQVAFYRSEEFRQYCGYRLENEDDRKQLLSLQLDLLLRERYHGRLRTDRISVRPLELSDIRFPEDMPSRSARSTLHNKIRQNGEEGQQDTFGP